MLGQIISVMNLAQNIVLCLILALVVTPAIYAVVHLHWDRDLPAIPFGFDHAGSGLDTPSLGEHGGPDADRIGQELRVLALHRRDGLTSAPTP